MLNILVFFYNLIDQHIIWLYAACLLMIAFHVRSYLVAHRDRVNTIFTIEKEVAAHREGRAMSAIGTVLALAAIITAAKFYLAPTIDVSSLIEPTPTLTLAMPTREPATPTVTPTLPTATPRSSPTRQAAVATPTSSLPTATPQAPAAACADPNVRITSPGMNATVSGRVVIRGVANHGQFQFYKVEYSQGEEPGHWNVVNTIHRSPVLSGQLEDLDTTALPNGVYWLQLTVVDQTGNFPAPCRVRIAIQN